MNGRGDYFEGMRVYFLIAQSVSITAFVVGYALYPAYMLQKPSSYA
jgi:hypothetical protein